MFGEDRVNCSAAKTASFLDWAVSNSMSELFATIASDASVLLSKAINIHRVSMTRGFRRLRRARRRRMIPLRGRATLLRGRRSCLVLALGVARRRTRRWSILGSGTSEGVRTSGLRRARILRCPRMSSDGLETSKPNVVLFNSSS